MNEILKQLLNVIYSRTQLRAAALKLQDQIASQAILDAINFRQSLLTAVE